MLGPVFRAYQPDPGRLVAVKQFRLDVPPETAHRFVAALDRLIAADLTHLGIAAPLAVGMTDNTPFLALDFVAAESFDVVIRDYGPAPVTEALRIATQLGGALDFAAAVHVFHGALHPRDVLVSTDDTRVTGLGTAQALEEVGITAPIRRPYTAPERVAGGAWDRRADTFSLAALVYEMLFGRRIAGLGPDAAEAITGLEGADLPSLQELFAKALAENPADRFETALAFAEALHGVLSPPALPEKGSRSRRKREADAAPGRTTSIRSGPPALPLDHEAGLPLTLAADDAGSPLDGSAERPDSPDLPLATIQHDAEIETAPERMRMPEPTAAAEPPAIRFDEPREPTMRLEVDDEPVAIPDLAASSPTFDDLDLKAAEDERYVLAESMALPETASPIDTVPPQPAALDQREADVASARERTSPETRPDEAMWGQSLSNAALEESRSAVWPIVLALVVGLLVGFAGGYGVAQRERTTTGATVSDADPQRVPAPALPPPPAGSGAAVGQAPPDTTAAPERPSDAPREATEPPAPAPGSEPAREPAAPRARQSAPPERSAPDAGRLNVRSTPPGARVIVDGRDVGATPLALNSVSRGLHVVRITHQGYVAAERRVRIRATQTAQSIEVALVATRAVREAAPPPLAPERTSGSVMFDSRPAGARVFLDGKLVGTTPMLLDAVAVGDHAVRLELDGFMPWTVTTRVAGGERTRVSGSLEQR